VQIVFRMAGDDIICAQKDKQLTIDSDQLSQEDASELKGLVAASRIFDLPPLVISQLDTPSGSSPPSLSAPICP
jgi:hypothetical protein